MRTFGQELKEFLKTGEHGEFALETHRTQLYVTYVVCSELNRDPSWKPVRAYFEQKELLLPLWPEFSYPPEIKAILNTIKNTTNILTQSE